MNGKNAGLVSEAGCPSIADPGAEIIQFAHRNGIRVVPLVGPSSILLALSIGIKRAKLCFQRVSSEKRAGPDKSPETIGSTGMAEKSNTDFY